MTVTNLAINQQVALATILNTKLEAPILLAEIDPNILVPYAQKTQEAWIAATLVGGWVNYDAGANSTAGYYKDTLGVVRLKGLLKNGVSGGFFTLPVGYRPLQGIHVASTQNSTFAEVIISANGLILNGTALAAAGTYYSLDGLSFRAEQ